MKKFYKKYKSEISKLLICMISLLTMCVFGITMKVITCEDAKLISEIGKGILVLFISFFLFSGVIIITNNKKG